MHVTKLKDVKPTIADDTDYQDPSMEHIKELMDGLEVCHKQKQLSICSTLHGVALDVQCSIGRVQHEVSGH